MASGDKIYVAREAISQKILAAVTGMHAKRYGYRVKLSEGIPVGRVEYIHDAVGMTPAYMNFGSAFNYGSWGNIWFVRDNFPCMATYDGYIDYRLKATDYTLRASGAASDVANTAYAGNAMSALPCVWYTRYTEDGYYYFICCEQQYDTTYWADVHTRSDGTIANYDLDAIYKGSYITTDNKIRLRSLSGQRPGSNTSGTTEMTYAKNCGDKWTLRKWNRWSLIGDLLCLMSKSCHSQNAFGQGHTTGGSSAESLLDTGTLDTSGYSDTTHAMKVFHQENWYGDRWDRCVGLICRNGQVLTRMNQVTGEYNFTGDGYSPFGVDIADGG